MFDFFRFIKKNSENSNVVNFPAPKSVPPMPEVVPPPEKPATVYYRIGVTDKNRVSLQIGYGEITMNKNGIQNLIDQLALFRDQIADEDEVEE